MKIPCMITLLFACAFPVSAQTQPLSSHANILHQGMKMILMQSAERMPEEHYTFRPAETVRTYLQILGHLADVHYEFCSAIIGEKNPTPNIEKNVTSKVGMINALRDAGRYCDKAFAGLTDTSGVQLVSFNGGRLSKLSLVGVGHMHLALHYGNLVTYMRIKGVIPPTSDPALMRPPAR